VRWQNNGNESGSRGHLPVAGVFEFNTLVTMLLGLAVARLLVDVDVLAMLGTAETLFLGEADLLLDVSVAVVGLRVLMDGG